MQHKRIIYAILALSILLSGALPAIAAAPTPLAITSYTIDNGGHLKSNGGGRFQLSGAIGQADSTNEQQAGQRTLTGGFWSAYRQLTEPLDPAAPKIFLPLISR